MYRGRGIVGGVAGLLAACAMGVPTALAGGIVQQGYPCATMPAGSTTCGTSGAAPATQPVTHNVAAESKTVSRTSPAVAGVNRTHAVGALPFTGAQLGVVVLLGALLISAGLVLRASGKPRTSV